VARLICQGRTNKEIAIELSLSPDTVKTHVHKALIKLGLRRKGELIKHYISGDTLTEVDDRSLDQD
jgi:DNA-binding CsgD family transcriptional regulator